MLQNLNQDEISELANLLVISQKANAREALCIKVGINYYKQLGFMYESSSEDSFAINLINHLNVVGNTKAICQICCKELAPIFQEGRNKSFLKKIAAKLNCNQEFSHNHPNPSTVEQLTSPIPNPVLESRINPPNQPDRAKSQRLYWLTSGAIFLIGLAGVAGFQIRGQMELSNSRYIYLEKLLSEEKWEGADRETANRMWEVADKWQERSLQAKDYNNFSCEDLRTIDNLWTKYSKQRFGFSIQRQIWESREVSSNLDNFIIRVGWGKRNEKGEFTYHPVTEFSLKTPEGQLPWIVNWEGSGDRNAYMDRIKNCDI